MLGFDMRCSHLFHDADTIIYNSLDCGIYIHSNILDFESSYWSNFNVRLLWSNFAVPQPRETGQIHPNKQLACFWCWDYDVGGVFYNNFCNIVKKRKIQKYCAGTKDRKGMLLVELLYDIHFSISVSDFDCNLVYKYLSFTNISRSKRQSTNY